MSVHESPWPQSARGNTDSGYFHDSISDQELLTPSTTATFGTTSIRINPGSELPHHPPSSSGSPPLKPYPRKTTNSSSSGKAPNLMLPLTPSTRVIKSTPISTSRPEEVWREMLKTSYGRDKAFVHKFRVMQFTSSFIRAFLDRKLYNTPCV